MRAASLLFALLTLAPLSLRAQFVFPVYSDTFDDSPVVRRGVEARWSFDAQPVRPISSITGTQLHAVGPFTSESAELQLGNLPAHEEVILGFVLLATECRSCDEQIRVSVSEGQRWSEIGPEFDTGTATDATALAFTAVSGQAAWYIERRFQHEAATLGLRVGVPDLDETQNWSIGSVTVQVAAQVKTLDISGIRGGSGKRRAIVFCATEGFPSHGFLVFSQSDARAHRTTVAAYGLYPDPTVSLSRVLLHPVPGVLVDDMQTTQFARARSKLVVFVSARQYRVAQAVIGRWRCQPTYRLLSTDCVELTRDVATELGLTVPPRGLLQPRPADYIRDLITAN